MEALPKEVQDQLDQLKKNISRMDGLYEDIQAGKEASTGVDHLKTQFANLSTENAKIIEDTKAAIEKDVTDRQDAFEIRVKELIKTSTASGGSELEAEIEKAVKEYNLGPDWRGRVNFEVKNITNLSTSAGPLLVPQYQPGLIMDGKQRLLVKQLLGGGNTTSTVIVYFREKVSERTDGVEYQEAHFELKGQSDFVYEQFQASIRDIAHWVYIARQMLSDVPFIRATIENEMVYMLNYFEEKEILNGAGGANAMEGLNTAADAFDVSLVSGVQSAQELDTLRKAMVQVGRTFFPPTGIILNPEDVANIELLKDGEDRYLWVNPVGVAGRRFWGLPVVETYAQTSGEFTVGAFVAAADYWQRQGVRVEISTEDGDNFRRNRATLLAERRGTTAIKRPSAIVHGTFSGGVS